MATILVVDDNPDVLAALELLLTLHQHKVICADSKMKAVTSLSQLSIDLVVQDMNFTASDTSGEQGKALFYELRAVNPNIPVVLITAWTQLETAIELVKAGAIDYLPKPWDDQKLLDLVAKHSGLKQCEEPKQDVILASPAMQNLYSQAKRVAVSDINILITGPNGAGKEKLADYIHQHSERKQGPLVKVNMGAIPAELMEAELFGAEKGAYTGANERRVGRFESAHGGTLFLDEIGNLPLAGQIKLLRVLQTGEFEKLGASQTQKVDVRVLSATNSDLPEAISRGSFREDLYYRLNVLELNIPPLNKRKEDILPLAQHFVTSNFTLADDTKAHLLQHHWPGNVRELENFCRKAMALSTSSEIHLSEVQGEIAGELSEKQQIENALAKHNGVIKTTAEYLGLSRQALYRRIEKYQIEV